MAEALPILDDSPRFTADLIGHSAAEQTFLDAYNGGRMHHAWLITGPKGVGKATLAWRIAKFLCAEDAAASDDAGGLFGEALPKNLPASLATDPESTVVQRILAGGHGGIRIIERTVNEKTGKMRNEIPIDDVRGLTGFFQQTSAEGGWRIAIIDAADEMNTAAANALLKLLEEPPAKSILLLVAHAPGRLLPTIRSRCRTLALRPLDTGEVANVLSARYPDLDTASLQGLAALSDGAPGRAVTLQGQGGLILYETLSGMFSSLPDLTMSAVHGLADTLAAAKNDADYRLFVMLSTGWFERLVRLGASGIAGPEVVAGETAAMHRLASVAGVDRWLALWEKVGQQFARADAVNLDRKQVILSFFTSAMAVARGQG